MNMARIGLGGSRCYTSAQIFLNPTYAMPDFDPPCHFVRNPGQIATDMDDDGVMMNVERAE